MEADRLLAERLAAEHAEALRQHAAESAEPETEPAALAPMAPTAPPVAPVPPVPKSPEDTTVLVADDSKVVRVKTSRVLVKHLYRVVLAEDGLQALQQIEASPPDVLVTDVEMPGLDGFELTRRVRADPRTAHIPIIMITSADDSLALKAREAGVSLLLGKPYDDAALVAHIEASLGHPSETALTAT
jgi:CheY-like chemotaxis protein